VLFVQTRPNSHTWHIFAHNIAIKRYCGIWTFLATDFYWPTRAPPPWVSIIIWVAFLSLNLDRRIPIHVPDGAEVVPDDWNRLDSGKYSRSIKNENGGGLWRNNFRQGPDSVPSIIFTSFLKKFKSGHFLTLRKLYIGSLCYRYCSDYLSKCISLPVLCACPSAA